MAPFIYIKKGKIKTVLRFSTAVNSSSSVEVLKDRVSVFSEML